jgi:inward rectifier potassium channel
MFEMTQADFETSEAEIMILLSAMDETFAQMVHTRTSYKPEEMRVGYKFVSIYNETKPNEPLSIDIRKLSQIEKFNV